MADGGKGSAPRPIPDREAYESNWDAIFGKKATWDCQWCKQSVPNDVSHNCPNWLDMVNESEARFNAAQGRSGVVWSGD